MTIAKLMSPRLAVALFSTILLAGCVDSGRSDLGMRSSDADYMRELTAELQAAEVQFRVDDKGMIRYESRDEEVVKAIADRVRDEMSSGTSVKFETEEEKRYFLAMLDSAKKKYRIETRADGDWIRWYPDDEAESQELPARAMEKLMASRRNKLTPQ